MKIFPVIALSLTQWLSITLHSSNSPIILSANMHLPLYVNSCSRQSAEFINCQQGRHFHFWLKNYVTTSQINNIECLFSSYENTYMFTLLKVKIRHMKIFKLQSQKWNDVLSIYITNVEQVPMLEVFQWHLF